MKCDKSSGLFFSRSKNITIRNINFLSCGANFSQQHVNIQSTAALYFENVAALALESVNVLNSTGYGIIAAHVSKQVVIPCSAFQGNRFSGGNARLSFQECSPDDSSSLLIQSTEFMYGSTRMNHSSGLMVEIMCSGVTVQLDNVTASNNRGGNVQFKTRDSYNWQILITRSKIIGGHGVMGSGLYFSSTVDHHLCNGSETVGLGSSMTIRDTHFGRMKDVEVDSWQSSKIQIATRLTSHSSTAPSSGMMSHIQMGTEPLSK